MGNEIENITEKDIEKQVEKHLKRNWTFSYLDGIFITGGLGFVAVNTVLTYFVSEFTNSTIIIGLLTSVHLLGKYLPQMLGAKILEGKTHNKKYVAVFGLLQRLPWFLMAFITYNYAIDKPEFTLLSFYVLYGFYSVVSGMFSPGWLDLIAKVIPLKLRGRFFGIRKFLGGGVQFFGSFAVAWLFAEFIFPNNYAIAFLITGISTSISYIFLVNMKEVGKERKARNTPFSQYIKKLPIILKNNKNFTMYIVSSGLIVFYNMATAFYIIYGKEQLNVGSESIGILTGILLATQSVFSIFWGYVSDKKGHKAVLVVSVILFILSSLTILFTTHIYLLYIVFFLNGAAVSAWNVSEMNIVLEFAPQDERPTYLGLTNTLIAPLVSITPIIGGWILQYFNYNALMISTMILMSIGLYILAFHVKDPRVLKDKKL